MRLTEEQRELQWQIETVCYRCIHAVEYSYGVAGKGEDEFWIFTENCYSEIACLLWCHIFNSRNNDPVHYWTLFGGDRLSGLGKEFLFDSVQQRLWSAAGLDASSYEQFRIEVVTFRNEYVAHRNYERESIPPPPLDKVRAMCLEMRLILEEAVRAELQFNKDDDDCEELLQHYSDYKNDSVLQKCRDDIRCNGPEAV